MLRQSGIRVLDVQIRDFEGLFDSIQQIGDAMDRHQQAEGVVARMQAELEAITTGGATPWRQRPRVFVEIGDQPLMTAGGGLLGRYDPASRWRECGTRASPGICLHRS